MEHNNYTYQEISRQPETWEKTISVLDKEKSSLLELVNSYNPDEVIFIGSGTSYYISISAALTMEEMTGLTCRAIPSSEIFLKPSAVIPKHKRVLFVAFSRSGTTSEVIMALKYLHNNNIGIAISFTGNPQSKMSEYCESTIVLPHIQEKSVVMTSSFTNQLLGAQLFSAFVANDEKYEEELKSLPDHLRESWNDSDKIAKELGESLNYKQFIYLGLGSYFGLASEGMLKMKEMTQEYSEAFNPLEFRHGPISVVNEKTLIILIGNQEIFSYEKDLIHDLQKLNATVLYVGESPTDLSSDQFLQLRTKLSDVTRGVISLPLLQLLAYYRNLALGLNPDKPKNLNQVVKLKGE